MLSITMSEEYTALVQIQQADAATIASITHQLHALEESFNHKLSELNTAQVALTASTTAHTTLHAQHQHLKTTHEQTLAQLDNEYTLLQYENERYNQDLLYWRKIAAEALEKNNYALVQNMNDIDDLTRKVEELTAENEEYRRTNERIWETTKVWIMEDSSIISKQAGQIKYLLEKLKQYEKKVEN